MTGNGRHAARRAPGFLVKLAAPTGFAMLLGLAFAGWLLFSRTPTDAALVQDTSTLFVPPSGPEPAVAPAPTLEAVIEPEVPELLPKSAEAVMALVGPVSRLNWAAMARCESRGNPRSMNRAGYYGLYQFSMPAWKSVGGSGRPSDATVAEQTMRAQMLYLKRGRHWQGSWPDCGRHLFG